MHPYFGGAVVIGDLVALRNSGDRVLQPQSPALGIIFERRYGALDFINHVHIPAIRVKGEVPGSGAWRRLAERRIVGSERSLSRIETIYHDFVQAQIGG